MPEAGAWTGGRGVYQAWERVQAAAETAAATAANEQQIAIIERTARSINQLTSCQGSRHREMGRRRVRGGEARHLLAPMNSASN